MCISKCIQYGIFNPNLDNCPASSGPCGTRWKSHQSPVVQHGLDPQPYIPEASFFVRRLPKNQ